MTDHELIQCAQETPNHCSWLLAADGNAPEYHVRVALPDAVEPREGWPALFVLDGECLLGTFAEAIGRLSRRGDATGVIPAAIIAVAAVAQPGIDHRKRDFATPASQSAGDHAEADRFLRLIEGPMLASLLARLPLDPDRIALLGHSLAGYFVLHAIGSPSTPFSQFVALSPSIWWDAAHLRRRIERIEPADRRAFLAVGEWEGALPPWQVGQPLAESALMRRRERQMIANTQNMAQALVARLGPHAVSMRLFDDEDHASMLTRSVAPALRFLTEGWRT
ncbi:alpha/beta hydrolase [Aurantiacibacter flavus]|uniref:Alpha/beta hydrolase-fold protein n=1 Tax=Aurantiacibacter flavus TaxID=3145232 RepID=A0ABV0CY96_9SPHN